MIWSKSYMKPWQSILYNLPVVPPSNLGFIQKTETTLCTSQTDMETTWQRGSDREENQTTEKHGATSCNINFAHWKVTWIILLLK